ncbi:hypothetical protein C0989_012623 [Termitomyces sp. Mn162]|nr:hypothetical protein C0989_012623 [Termitomyces sp. Mn162]
MSVELVTTICHDLGNAHAGKTYRESSSPKTKFKLSKHNVRATQRDVEDAFGTFQKRNDHLGSPFQFDPNLKKFWEVLEIRCSKSDVDMLESLIEIDSLPDFSEIYEPSDDPYVLRNLITHQYIRSDAFYDVDISDEYETNPKYLCFMMAPMMLTMTCPPSI